MTSMNCSCRPNCVWLTLLAGILIGIAAALFLMNGLRWAGIIPPPPLMN